MSVVLIADSGSTKTHWACVVQRPSLPRQVTLAETQGLNPLYVEPRQITEALRQVLAQVGEGRPDEVRFYGSGCSGERVPAVEAALRAALTPMTRVTVQSDLMGAALALTDQDSTEPFIACIMGTGSIASLYEPASGLLRPMPALGYILGDEGSGAWYGRQLLADYLKHQLPARVVEAFEDDFGPISAEQAIRHVYQQPCPNRYLATFAAFVGRHLDLRYCQELAYRGCDAFWRRNVVPIDNLDLGAGVADVRLVGSVAWHLRAVLEQVAQAHDYLVTRILKDPIQGLI